MLNDVSEIHTERELLGAKMRIPIVLPPIGSVQQFEAGGGVSVAEAAAEFGTTMILSSAALPEFETVAKTPGCSKIFQLYLIGDRAWMDDIIGRTIEAGYDAFCLTVDTALYSRRERDITSATYRDQAVVPCSTQLNRTPAAPTSSPKPAWTGTRWRTSRRTSTSRWCSRASPEPTTPRERWKPA